MGLTLALLIVAPRHPDRGPQVAVDALVALPGDAEVAVAETGSTNTDMADLARATGKLGGFIRERVEYLGPSDDVRLLPLHFCIGDANPA